MTERVPSRLSAALADRYRIERELGAGGMATVYLAHDVRHERAVALKVLRPELAAVIGGARFLAEIKTTANLQHPHILPLFDSGEVDGMVFYVMPFVEGESLRDRLVREKQLPINDAVRIAAEIASALIYAHRQGVIHRDIKPENILLHDDRAVVADFGIALAATTVGGARMTETGMSLGTPAYMSPEQAMGERTLDARTDVYALGVVLYEMLIGEPPFTGPTAQAIVAKVMTERPAGVIAHRDRVPQHVEDAVLSALEKLPADRFATMADFARALVSEGTGIHKRGTPASGSRMSLARSRRSATRWLGWAVAAAAVAVAAWGRLHAVPLPIARFTLGFASDRALDVSSAGTHIAISPDGDKIVYTGADTSGTRLWLKTRDRLQPIPLAGTEGAYNPFFSPDGRDVGFFAERNGRTILVMSLAGGPPRPVVGPPLGQSGATWGSDGNIYFDGDNEGLQRIALNGTGRTTIVPLDTLHGEVGIAWPEVLPSAKVVLFRLRRGGDTPRDFMIAAVRIGTTERKDVVRAVSTRYAPTGHLLFVTADGVLQAARFDESKLALTSPPIAVAEGVRVAGTYASTDVSLGTDGTLSYVSGPFGVASRLVWVDRRGVAETVDSLWRETGEIRGLSLSPDGRRVALELVRAGLGGTDIWIKQLPSGALTRLTFHPSADLRPSWSGDAQSVLFLSERLTPEAAFMRRADGTGSDKVIASLDRDLAEVQQSRDGRWLIARTANAQAGAGDILAMQLGVDTVLHPLVAGPFSESNPALSPDGHRLAYVSTESGRREVYVRPFPEVGIGVAQVSSNGGTEPRWSRSGAELFFRATGTSDMMVVSVQTSPTFSTGSARSLFHTNAALGVEYARYDVSLDGNRFLMVTRDNDGVQPQLVVVQSFLSALRQPPPQ